MVIIINQSINPESRYLNLSSAYRLIVMNYSQEFHLMCAIKKKLFAVNLVKDSSEPDASLK
jgi:hypothetical protein